MLRNHHHHHDVWLARISLTVSLHVSLSFIAFGRSSGLHPVSSHSCCMNIRAGRPAFDWPYAGVHRSTSLTISSLLLQQCPACLVRLACIVFVIGGRWPYSYLCHVLINQYHVGDPHATNFRWASYYFCIAVAAGTKRSVWCIAGMLGQFLGVCLLPCLFGEG